jgi:hypothetical protein
LCSVDSVPPRWRRSPRAYEWWRRLRVDPASPASHHHHPSSRSPRTARRSSRAIRSLSRQTVACSSISAMATSRLREPVPTRTATDARATVTPSRRRRRSSISSCRRNTCRLGMRRRPMALRCTARRRTHRVVMGGTAAMAAMAAIQLVGTRRIPGSTAIPLASSRGTCRQLIARRLRMPAGALRVTSPRAAIRRASIRRVRR